MGTSAGIRSGPQLKLLRMRLGINASAVADALSVSTQRISTIEGRAVLRPTTRERVLGALRGLAVERRDAIDALYGSHFPSSGAVDGDASEGVAVDREAQTERRFT